MRNRKNPGNSVSAAGFPLLSRTLAGIGLSVLSAVLLVLSMPPHGIWPLALVGLIPMILAQYRILPKRITSLAPSITIAGLVALYIMDAFLELPNAPWYMRLLPVFFGLVVLLTASGNNAFQERTSYRWFVLSGAVGWIGIEMVRGFIPLLGTWGFISYAYFKQPWLIQPVSIFGIYGLGLLTMLVEFSLGLAALSWFDKYWHFEDDPPTIKPSLISTYLILSTILFSGWVVMSLLQLNSGEARTIRVAAIQPNYREFWTYEEDQSNLLPYHRYLEIGQLNYTRMKEQSREASSLGAELIVWPEGGLVFDPQVENSKELQDLAQDTNAYLVIAYGVDWRNELTVLSPQREYLGVYGKNHPVSFVGERSETAGSYQVYDTELGKIGAIICYDMDFTDTARRVARNGASLIAVPSGDWPGIADKHYAHLVFRAVENRTAMIKADRSYDSAIIDPYGRITERVVSVEGIQATLVNDVMVFSCTPPQQILGDWIGWLCLGGLIGFAILDPITKRRQGIVTE